jgi:ATP-dependent Lhr-like helicase
VHDALLRIGDLTLDELTQRTGSAVHAAEWLETLTRARRVVALRLAAGADERYVAVEDASRYRDALGVTLPAGLPETLLASVKDPLRDLSLRYARTHAPFTLDEWQQRLGLARGVAESQLERLVAEGKLLEGAFRPGGTQREYAHAEVLRTIRQRSLAKLRKAVEPVEPSVLGRFATQWHGITHPRAGIDAVLDAIEKLQGVALPASLLEREILRARAVDYRPGDLDALVAAGEVMWCGVERLGDRDGRVALYLTDHFPRLWTQPVVELDERETRIVACLAERGASFFSTIHAQLGGGYPKSTVDALWALCWKGVVTNDTFRALRTYMHRERPRRERPTGLERMHGFRSRREAPTVAEGRWSLLTQLVPRQPTQTERATAWAQLLLQRYGVVTRELAASENIAGGFSALYDVFKALEDAGRIRRGYFVAGVGAMQFAAPGVLERLRTLRLPPAAPEVVHLAATDPANPYGASIRWPALPQGRSPARAAGARVILIDGALAAYLARGSRQLQSFLPDAEPDRSIHARCIAERLRVLAIEAEQGGLLLAEIDGAAAEQSVLGPALREAGFLPSKQGFYLPRRARGAVLQLPAAEPEQPDEAQDV